MIDWVHWKLKSWGYQKRRINGRQPQPKSIMGRIMEEGPGAAIRGAGVEPLEVYLGDALEVACALRLGLSGGMLTQRHWNDAHDIYVSPEPVKRKCRRMCLSRQGYYNRMYALQVALVGLLPETVQSQP